MELVERAEQAMHLKHLLAQSGARKGKVVLLDGPSGSGKTELLRQVADHAADTGCLVLRAACSRAESALPLGVLGQLLRSAPIAGERAAELDLLLRRAGEEPAAGATGDIGAPGQEAPIGTGLARVLHDIAQALLSLADDATVLVTIDDIRHADRLSLDCLLYLCRRTGSARMTAVLTDDSELPDGPAVFRTELLDQPHAARTRLAPLSEAGVAAMLAAHLDRPSAERLAPEFQAIAAGNLLLLHALLEDHLETGGVRREGYGRAVLRQLSRAEASVTAVARALAVLDTATTPERLARLSGLDGAVADAALRALRAAGLVHGTGYRHDIARQSILDRIPADERAALRVRAAELLYEQGAPAPETARLLVDAAAPAGPWSVDVLLEAAEQELIAGRAHRAAEALEAALTADHETPADRAAVESRLVQVRRLSDPATAEHHLTALTEAARAGDVGPAHTVDLVRQLLWQGRSAEARELLGGLRETELDPHGEDAALLHDTEQWIAWTHPTVARRARRPGPPAAAGAGRPPAPGRAEPWSRPTAVLAGALVGGRAHEVVDRAEQVLRDRGPSYDITWPEEPALLALGVLLCADRPDAAAWCDRLLSEGHTPYSPTWMALLSATRAEAAVRLGDLTAAVDHAQLALGHVTPNAWGVALGAPLGSLVLATTRMGHYDETESYLTRSVPKAMFETRYGLHYLHARGQFHLATGHHHAALADFLACGERMRGWGIDVPGIVPWRTSAAEAWLALGNREQAARLAYDQLGRPGTDGARARAGALRVLAVGGPVGRRPQMLAEALELFEQCGDRYEQTRVLADLSEAYHQLGDNRRARTQARRARHLVGLCGAAPLNEALLSFLDEGDDTSGSPVPSPESALLTGSERRVAALAVGGYTNREIAVKLFITPSTVEQHLTRVYRKLGVRCRKDLPVELTLSGAETVNAGGQA
ncbi:helix-turn-helix transcriptional regulator [Streptomyces zhihengii]|uniref:AAA family ATPase n=1 Tax=Streptomyces zhihengii TaxID=1818004 RepID=A0ABS2UMC1_9ACTN|nr:LuxR family transcriptional regulator [Streptomyces zhihengii]MBM9618688.1 AAA family ATPase [Streptomyces zhihengii]